ncbi:ATP-binding protein [Kitasatospora sp. NPDC057500]|uniref:ATP-binding protein n=1 Tax=Kitasatospora sp. NPDC057500 TaxID=3346151 RepID=UPI0036A4B494
MCNRNTPSLAVSREALRSAMVLADFHPDTIADAELALVELIVNAWRHGDTASPIVLLLLSDEALRVSVGDNSSDLPAPLASTGLAECGRGLQLVQGLTHRWGAEPQKRGKLVWFEFDRVA